MTSTRRDFTLTLLPGGNVLAVGGYNGAYLSSAEIYTPASGLWSSAGVMSAARDTHRTLILPNGKVFVIGGANGGGYLSSAELYDPNAGTWAQSGILRRRRYRTGHVLPNGKVLLFGVQWRGAPILRRAL